MATPIDDTLDAATLLLSDAELSDADRLDESLLGGPLIGGREADAFIRQLDADDRLDRIASDLQEVARMQAMLDARRVTLMALADEVAELVADIPVGGNDSYRLEMSHRSVVAEVSCALRTPQQTIAAEIGTAVQLSRMPATMSALWSGTISYRHAAVIADTCSTLPRNDAGTQSELEAALLPIAESATVAKLRRKARVLREQLHPELIAQRTENAFAERRVVLEPIEDGMAWLHHLLPIAAATGIYETSDQLASGMRGTIGNALGVAEIERTMAQLRSDALTELFDAGLTALANMSDDEVGGREAEKGAQSAAKKSRRLARVVRALRPSVFVMVPVMTLLGLSEEPGTLDGYGPIDPDTARRLAADAPSFYRILTHPITGTVLDVDRKRYRPPADMKRWLRLRDQTCRFPFCGRRAQHSDLDHRLPWQHGGTTSTQNLAHMCGGDHTLRHGSSWTVIAGGGGVLHWTSPSGRCYTTEPETPIGMQAARVALANLAAARKEADTSGASQSGRAADVDPPF